MRRLTVKFSPDLSQDVEEEGVPSHDVFAGIAGGTSEQDDQNLLTAHQGDGVAEPRHWNVTVHF